MATIITKVESARGCGFRQAGGFYMVADGKGSNCGCLPFDVPDRIKTVSRFPQWLKFWEVAGKKNDRKQCGKECCWLSKVPSNQMVMLSFVGMSYYKEAKHFLTEVARAGISRRINPKLLSKITVGQTVVLLAHREASSIPTLTGFEKVRQVFAAFKPQRIEYIVKGDEDEAYLDKLEAQGITLINVQRAGHVLELGFQSN